MTMNMLQITLFLCLTASAGATTTPNIIFILFDDMGYSDISARGAEYDTPHFDYLHSNAIILSHHYTGLLCSPSRSQMLTGRYAWNMGISDLTAFGQAAISAIPSALPTIGNLLSDYTEYTPYALGKWHVGYSTDEHTPLDRGFNEFYGFLNSGISYSDKTCTMSTYNYVKYIDWRANRKIDYDTQYEFSTYVTGDKLKYIINKHSNINSKKENESNDPFYVYAAFQAMHGVLELLDSDTFDGMAACDGITDESRLKYCQNVIVVDQVLGDMTSELKKNNLWDDTLIVITSDNGGEYDSGACNYPLRGGKNDFFEGGIRTFSFVTGGYIDNDQTGTTRDQFIHGVDWTPTLLSIAGADVDTIEKDLQKNLYVPLAKSISKKINGNEDKYEDYLMDKSLDGMDMSSWLLKGSTSTSSDTTHTRSAIPLSVNSDLVEQLEEQLSLTADEDRTSQQNHSTAIIFESQYTGSMYKVMSMYQTPYSYDLCSFSDTNGSRIGSTSKKDMSTNLKWLIDLTIDTTETTNLIDYLDNEDGLLDYDSIDLDSIPTIKNVETGEIEYNYDINKISDYESNKELIELLWHEANAAINEYMDNNLFNRLLDCTRGSYTTEANPSKFNNAWSPFYTWDEYKNEITSKCSEQSNDVLLTLYTTKYDDYTSKSNSNSDNDEINKEMGVVKLGLAGKNTGGKHFDKNDFGETFLAFAVIATAVILCFGSWAKEMCSRSIINNNNNKSHINDNEYVQIGP